jgi:uncharacterized protein
VITETEAYNALWAVLDHSSGHDSRIHGELHWSAVAAAGYHLCKMAPEADPRIVLLFAMFHDAARESDGHDPEHGARAAELAYKLQESGDLELDDEQLATLEEALTLHDKGQTSADPTIGACWDSDRINLYRVGITPEASFMSTEGGRSLVGTKRAEYFPIFVFSWTAIFLNFEALMGPGEHVYLRFGDLPESGFSHYSSYTRPEEGVSVYPGHKSRSTYQIDTRRLMMGTETRFVRHLLHQGRPLYVVEGEHIGMGGSGEPVLADAHIVREVTPDDCIEVLPKIPEVEECIEWWRSKRRGESVGEFPYPLETSLSCDRSAERAEDVLTAHGLGGVFDTPLGRAYLEIKSKLKLVQRYQRELWRDPSNAAVRQRAMQAGFELSSATHKLKERSKTPRQRELEKQHHDLYRRTQW